MQSGEGNENANATLLDSKFVIGTGNECFLIIICLFDEWKKLLLFLPNLHLICCNFQPNCRVILLRILKGIFYAAVES